MAKIVLKTGVELEVKHSCSIKGDVVMVDGKYYDFSGKLLEGLDKPNNNNKN